MLIVSKPHAHLRTMNKTSAKFQKEQTKTLKGVAFTIYVLTATTDGRKDRLIRMLMPTFKTYPTRTVYAYRINERKKAKIRNQYNQVPHLTQDTVWKSDKISRKHHIQESQEVKSFPAGDQKAA